MENQLLSIITFLPLVAAAILALFMRGDEVEAAWAWADPIIQGWETRGDKPQAYDAGSSGPDDAMMLMHRDGRRWRDIR